MSKEILNVKQRFGLVGNSIGIERAIITALQVAPTDMSVLIVGESGTGKEMFPKIIHQYSARKHQQYIAVNCGAIPEGTIDSELFGHEKGAFTGAIDSRKGYFEVADGGTIFLDEVGELPLQTQVRLLRILETGEYMRVGSSKMLKTNVRIVAATNANFENAIREGKFREDLFYRLNTVPIKLPALRERKEDIYALFTRFASDSAEKYKFEPIRLTPEALQIVEKYRWPGNIRQLKNVVEQMSIIERDRMLTPDKLVNYLPEINVGNLPTLSNVGREGESHSEREILFKVLFDMRKEIRELRQMVYTLMDNRGNIATPYVAEPELMEHVHHNLPAKPMEPTIFRPTVQPEPASNKGSIIEDTEEIQEESFSLIDKEKEMIKLALDKHDGKRKLAAEELGISERTLYRKIKEYDIN
ncbi:MAG: sigma-54 dependent transcriptional regulator [Salinivirgaceae bacterium]|nr:sigma-54 dependent transcriptional regulator [Salinivirgaceae bacterium]MDD4747027.1 sigma-54 dependent transcriptional regulator [Salinivirgaceae bacterium]MDY0279552.1 sigma-54 dependent transcriptional regulator [Salinivirgaceae bacterium]